jgi:POT family proton-dependent oligopeptide transporter
MPEIPIEPGASLAAARRRTTPYDTDRMPPGVPYIIGNEAAERFSYYGMASILTIFLTQHLLGPTGQPAPLDSNRAYEWTHNFFTAVYFFPIFGALLSDVLLGKYRTIFSVSLLYCLGHAVMAAVDVSWKFGVDPKYMIIVALTLISIGAGGIKPCVSANVGDQFGPRNKHLIPRVFAWFYFSINFGSTFSTLLIPLLLDKVGPAVAFGVPGVLMGVATLAFWMGRNKFVHIPPGGVGFLKEAFGPEGLRAILNLAPLFILLAPFWGLFDQSHTAWVVQAEKMDRNLFGWTPSASQLQAVNPILVLILIPIFTYVIYPLMGKFFTVTPLKKIGIGLFLTAPSFALIAMAEERIEAGGTPHIIWQLAAYLILTAAEVMVSITSLEFSYTQGPRKMKSVIMGSYLLSISLGNLFTAQVNRIVANRKEAGQPILEGADYFWFFTSVMVTTAIVFAIYSQFYRGRTYIQGEEERQPA